MITEGLDKRWDQMREYQEFLRSLPVTPKQLLWAGAVKMEVSPELDNPLHTTLHCPDHGQFARLDIPGPKLLRSQFDKRLDVLEQLMVKHWLARHEHIPMLN